MNNIFYVSKVEDNNNITLSNSFSNTWVFLYNKQFKVQRHNKIQK